MQQMRFTKEGYAKLKAEYEDMQKKRPPVVEDLKKAREMGDLSENGYYKASKAKLSFIDGQLVRLSYYLKTAIVIDDAQKGNGIGIGTKVTISDGKTKTNYAIVGDMEANPSEGKISLLSPLGKALAGKNEGQEIALDIPAGKITYKILSVKR